MCSIRHSLAMAALMMALIATPLASSVCAQAAAAAGAAGAAGSAGAAGAGGAAGGGGNGGGGAGGSGGGGSGGGPPRFASPDADNSASCGGRLELSSSPAYGDPADAVKALSRATEHYLQQCACATPACVADALDQYAEALAVVAPRLPRQLRDMPNIVARAARRVRASRTPAAAVAALGQAITVIHKEIALIEAEDAETYRRETRGGNFVAETLTVASLSLERGGGL